MTKLFISYRSLDSARVDTFVARLRSLKNPDSTPRYDIWQDKTSIPVGQDWWKAIVQGIVDCEIFVFMISRESVQNSNCRAELSYAVKRNRPLIPFVLEGEYIYNLATGKNDIAFWDKIPYELNDGRFQFLFYEGAASVDQFNRATELLTQVRWRDIPASEPLDPRHVDDATNDTGLLYDRACDYAYRLEFEMAEKLFRRLLNWGDPLFRDDAHEWILLLLDYQKILRLDALSSTQHKIPDLWRVYVQQFPKPFAPLFDPKDLNSRYGTSSKPASSVSTIDAPVAPEPPLPAVAPTEEQVEDHWREVSGVSQSPVIALLDDLPLTTFNVLPAEEQIEDQQQDALEDTLSSLTAAEKKKKRQMLVDPPLRMYRSFYRRMSSVSVAGFLPAPFEWIDIPGEIGTTWKGEPYKIARYPITNAQFAKFIEARGYHERKWWTDLGWSVREKERWTQPRYWKDVAWNGVEQPVVGVSWYEVMAFCLWLNDVTDEKIMLPTENQWRYAAHGDSPWEYPWGDIWSASRSNTYESKIGGTTPVRQYEGKGDSPFGVVDMAGNVWEWCLTDYDYKTEDINKVVNKRVLLGGSFGNSYNYSRITFANGGRPFSRESALGFRVVALAEGTKAAEKQTKAADVPAPALPTVKPVDSPTAAHPAEAAKAAEKQTKAADVPAPALPTVKPAASSTAAQPTEGTKAAEKQTKAANVPAPAPPTVKPEHTPPAAPAKIQYKSSINALPGPFAWIEIPGKMGKHWKNTPYKISKYPITNAQFAKFIQAGGYRMRKWWTNDGWEARERGWVYAHNHWKPTDKAWTQPRFWKDAKWNDPEQPVVGVSWYESIAFCLWLSDIVGEKILLPSEDQWQYAAQGDDGRDYPWGRRWNKQACNTSESNIGKTTSVCQYEDKGNSPFDVVDMAGNVWEWCMTDFENKTNDINLLTDQRIVCGGSFYDDLHFARIASRDKLHPILRDFDIGFRVVTGA